MSTNTGEYRTLCRGYRAVALLSRRVFTRKGLAQQRLAADGKVKRRLPWPDRGGGLGDYNYYCRNMLAVAYLDGVRPRRV